MVYFLNDNTPDMVAHIYNLEDWEFEGNQNQKKEMLIKGTAHEGPKATPYVGLK